MDITYRITRELNCDVAVVGGGTAGVFAAIAAAKSGAKTMLIEKNSILGGTLTVANVNFPGLFFAWGKKIIDGPCWESIERTVALGGAVLPEITYKPERHWHEQIHLNRFIYTAVLFQMCREAGVELICNAMISAAEETDECIKLTVTDKSGLLCITAGTAIDATGDANLAQIVGCEVIKSEIQQPATPQNHISGYDLSLVSTDEIKEKFETAEFPEHITADKLIGYLRLQKIDMHVLCVDADTSKGKTQLEQRAYAQLLKVYKFYRSIKGLENIKIDFIAEETGVRETNRIAGMGTITADDYINGVFYPDSVCYAFYPIDKHVMDGINKVYHADDIVSKIPYSALIPKNCKHILCAGRCISSDTDANSAVRVEAVCMATGQVAGCAAALAVKHKTNVSNVSYSELCSSLNKLGAIVPTE